MKREVGYDWKERMMVSGIENEIPDFVKAEIFKCDVELERGDMKYADTYFLAKLIMHGNEKEKVVARAEWLKRTGSEFPYHPSFEGNEYPIENLRVH